MSTLGHPAISGRQLRGRAASAVLGCHGHAEPAPFRGHGPRAHGADSASGAPGALGHGQVRRVEIMMAE